MIQIIARHIWHLRMREETTLRIEIEYCFRQMKAKALRDMHVITDNNAHKYMNAEPHRAIDYPDGDPAHMVIACMCGKEWS